MTSWRRAGKRLLARLPKSDVVVPEFSGFCLTAAAILGFYSLMFPHHAGLAGAMLVRTLTRAFGQVGTYFLWLGVLYRGLRLLFRREAPYRESKRQPHSARSPNGTGVRRQQGCAKRSPVVR